MTIYIFILAFVSLSLLNLLQLLSFSHTHKMPSLRLPSLPFPSLLRSPHLLSPPLLHLRRLSTAAASLTTDSPPSSDHHHHHPWPEWVTFVNKLKIKGFFDGKSIAKDDDGEVYRDVKLLKDPCISFARDRFDVLKSLSSKEIETVVESGCPNLFRKAVNSAKRLRAYVQLDEGDVCSACNLRGSCDRAYVILKEPETVARTVDLVRILLFHALDPLVISGGQKPPGRELVEESARKLLSELIELSETPGVMTLPKPTSTVSKQKEQGQKFETDDLNRNAEMKKGDWICPQCNYLNFAKNLRCLHCNEDGPKRVTGDVIMKKGDWICTECNFMNFSRNLHCRQCKAEGQKRVGVDDVKMKKGDWNCTGCGFMNFASNKSCLRCRGQRPKRELNTGEWECPSCDFLNFRRNVSCLKCNCDRPKEKESENIYEEHLWKSPV